MGREIKKRFIFILFFFIVATLFAQTNDTTTIELRTMTIGTNFWDQAWGGSDPWKNGYQNAVVPDSLNDPSYNPWKREFIDEISFYSVLRFMDFARINNNHEEIYWNDRVKKDNINQGRIAIEWMIDICNRTNSDMWICFPELTVEDYWEGTAKLIKDKLNPSLKVYVEWSNETWNPQFSANQTAIDSGKVYDLWFPNDQGTSWGERRLAARYSTFNSIQIWEKFNEVFKTDSSRVVKVLSGSVADDWWDVALVNALTDSKINPNNILPDVFAIAPYVGAELNGSDPDILEKMNNGIKTAEAEIVKIRTVLEGTNQWSKQMPPHSGVSGLNMICYEGGQHILHQAASFAVNSGAYDWYINYLDMLSKYVTGPYMNYNHSSKWGDMAWGAKKNIGQSAVEAPKFMALHNWYNMYNRVEPGPKYLLTVNNGNGDGSYYSGIYVMINADEDSLGRVFDKWIGDTVFVAGVHKANTVVTMNSNDITITATYKNAGKTTRFEAEDAELIGSNTASSRSGFSGSGYVNGSTFDEDGDKIIFSVETEYAGNYYLRIGYGGFYGGKYQYINVNGVRVAYFEFPETSNWATIDYGIIDLNEGTNTISIEKSWGWMDVDFIEIDGDGITDIQNKTGQVIDKYQLFNNYPNPFNPDTNISYQLPNRALVKIKIYDILGKEVQTIVNEEQNSGIYKVTWNGNNSFGNQVASGIYFIRMQAGDFSSLKKMTLLR